MKRGKKLTLIALMVVVALAGTIGGVAMAQSGDEETSTTSEDARFAYLVRVCEIYQEKTGVAIDVDILRDALKQAGEEQLEHMQNQVEQHLIDAGVLTEEQLTELEEWLQSKPDLPLEELKEWAQSRPNDIPKRFGIGNQQGKRFAFGFGYAFGKGFGEGFGGWCQQGNGAE